MGKDGNMVLREIERQPETIDPLVKGMGFRLLSGASQNDAEKIEWILQKHPELVDFADMKKETAIMRAAQAGSADAFTFLLTKKQDLEMRNQRSQNLLMMIADSASEDEDALIKMAKALLEKAENKAFFLYSYDLRFDNAARFATAKNHPKLAEFLNAQMQAENKNNVVVLKEERRDIEEQSNTAKSEEPALKSRDAVAKKEPNNLEVSNFKVRSRYGNGRTRLSKIEKDSRFAERIVSGNPTEQKLAEKYFTEKGFEAILTGNTVRLAHLLKLGLSANAVDKQGRSLLTQASIKNMLETAKLLIEKGADVNYEFGKFRWSALSLAMGNKHDAMEKLLRENGAKDSELTLKIRQRQEAAADQNK